MEWQLYVERMDPNRFSRRALEYHPRRERSVGKPRNDGWMNSIGTATG